MSEAREDDGGGRPPGLLDRFLGLYASLNSFCLLVATSEQRREPLAEWPPRAGWKALL